MTTTAAEPACGRTDALSDYVLRTLPPSDVAALEAHLAECYACRQEADTLRNVVDGFAFWPTDLLRPSASLWGRLAQRIAVETGGEPVQPARLERSAEPDWKEVAPGISCKLLATDSERNRVSMLVRLAPGIDYPPHTHAGVEELHLLHGELWIDDRKLHAGDYNRAEPGTADSRVWSETGCTCVLITSTRDVLR
jgi:ChrR Cupin-like domain/Putative zinc-finger